MSSPKSEGRSLKKQLLAVFVSALILAVAGAGYYAATRPAPSGVECSDCAALEAGAGASAVAAAGRSASLFETSSFPDRWHCGSWPTSLGWLHIASDLTIWAAYLAIPTMLMVFLRRRRGSLPFSMVWVLFAAFVLFCGMGHLLEAVIFWWPAYRLAGVVKLLTAMVSAATVLALVRVLPLALTLRTPKQLERVVQERTRDLQKSERRFRGTFDQAAVGMAHVSLSGEILRVNRRFCEILDKQENSVLNAPLNAALGQDAPEGEPIDLGELVGDPGTKAQAVREITTAGEPPLWVNLTAAPNCDEHGEVKYFIVVLEDISLPKSLEAELRSTNAALEDRVQERTAELQRSNDDLEQFAYVASHDLQEPLRMVSSYMQLIEERYAGDLDAAAHEFIGFAVDGATRMKALITDLLAYSRVGARCEQVESVELEEVMRTVEDDLALAIADSKAVIEYSSLPAVFVDRRQLTQLLENLVGNAIKFCAAGTPKVEITAEAKGEQWLIRVADNGIGIDPKHAERVFQVFQRLHGAADYQGTGIGLAIAKKVVERNGGTIWAAPREAGGTEFCLTLPRFAPVPEALAS